MRPAVCSSQTLALRPAGPGPQAFEEMRSRPCPPDSIVYNAIIDVLWETGLAWAQRRAVTLFRQVRLLA